MAFDLKYCPRRHGACPLARKGNSVFYFLTHKWNETVVCETCRLRVSASGNSWLPAYILLDIGGVLSIGVGFVSLWLVPVAVVIFIASSMVASSLHNLVPVDYTKGAPRDEPSQKA